MRERGHLKALGVDGRDHFKMGLQEVGSGAWTGYSWLRTGTGDECLLMG